jgi:methionyl-tRNA formyltransferase
LAGDKSTGVSLFKIDEGLDTGDLVGVVETVIEPGENTQGLLARLTNLGVSLALQELPRLSAGIATFSSQVGAPTMAKKTTRADARILPGDTAATALAKVLAYNPEPMAWIEVNGQPLRILEAAHSSQHITSGVLEVTKRGVLLGFADGKSIELLLVQPAGKNPMAANDWFRGTKESERVIS